MDTFVYRVYTKEHSDKDSYVEEFGTYSSLEKAQERLKSIISKKSGDWKWSETGHAVYLEGAWPGEECYHYIDRICLDEDTEERTTVHT